MSTRIRFDAQKLSHDNFALSTVALLKTLPAGCSGILFDNVDTAIAILVSFDGGTNYKTIAFGTQLSVDCDGLKNYKIKSASGTPNVECLYSSEL